MMHEHYDAGGRDPPSGTPTAEKLRALRLDSVMS
jgi:hypothetical protein